MGRIAVLRIFNCNLLEGFSFVELVIINRETGQNRSVRGSLPSATTLQELLEQFHEIQTEWGRHYRWWREIEAADDPLTNQASGVVQAIKAALDDWLDSEDFRRIREDIIRCYRQLERLTIQTDNQDLERLPWSRWNVIDNDWDSSGVEVALANNPRRYENQLRKPVNILAILGSDTSTNSPENREHPIFVNLLNLLSKLTRILGFQGIIESVMNQNGMLPENQDSNINLSVDKKLIQNLPGAKTVLLERPTLDQFHDALDNNWDILFFAGHGQRIEEGDDARLHISETESVTIENLIFSLRDATEKGLKIAIFNSCWGLGIPRQLSDHNISIPYLIVMREPLHDRLAHKFLERKLQKIW